MKRALLVCAATLFPLTSLPVAAQSAQAGVAGRDAVAGMIDHPIMAISFIAGSTESGTRALNRALKALKPEKTTILKTLFMVDEQPMDNPAEWTIPKTLFWVTPFYQQLATELGDGAVILNPMIVDTDDNGEAILRSGADLSGVAVDIYFQAYQYPGYNGTTNTLGPRSEGNQVAPMTLVMDARDRSERAIPWAAIVQRIPQKAMSSNAQEWLGGKEFQVLLDQGPSKLAQQDKVTRKTVKKVRAEAAAILASDQPGSQLARYSAISGLPRDALLPDFLRAETRFRALQAKRLVKYIWDSPLGDSLQALLQAERKGQKALDSAWLTAGLTGLQSGGGTSMLNSLIEAQPAMGAMGSDMTSAMSPVLSQQVKLTSTIAQASAEIEAGSLQELRGKFKALATQSSR